jgi:hypothetical protein
MMNIERTKRELEEIDHRPTRIQRGKEVGALVASDHVALAEQKTQLETEAQEATTITNRGNYSALVISLTILTAALCLLDMPVQFVINRLALPSLSTLLLLVLSPAVTLGLAAITHAVAHAAFFDTVRPRRTVRRCLTAAAIFGAAAAVALTILLVARTASADLAGYLINAVSMSLWVLGESLPITAGLVSAAAYTLSYPQIRSRRIRKLRDRLDALDRFIEWIDRDHEEMEQQEHAKAKTGAAVAAFALLFLLHPYRAVAISPPTDTPCVIYKDATYSVDPAFLQEATHRVSETLPAFLESFHCSSLRVGTFSDEGAFAPSLEFQVPTPPTEKNCSLASAKLSGTAGFLKYFSGFNEYYQNTASEQCLQSQATQQEKFKEADSAFLARARSELISDVAPRGQCTSITPLLSRLLERRHITVLLVSDGEETCPATTPVLTDPPGASVILVLLPTRGDIQSTSPEALRRASMWQHRFPGIRIVLPDEITGPFWPRIVEQRGR